MWVAEAFVGCLPGCRKVFSICVSWLALSRPVRSSTGGAELCKRLFASSLGHFWTFLLWNYCQASSNQIWILSVKRKISLNQSLNWVLSSKFQSFSVWTGPQRCHRDHSGWFSRQRYRWRRMASLQQRGCVQSSDLQSYRYSSLAPAPFRHYFASSATSHRVLWNFWRWGAWWHLFGHVRANQSSQELSKA